MRDMNENKVNAVFDKVMTYLENKKPSRRHFYHSTGFAGLDRVLKGLGDSDLTLIASHPGVGNSELMLNIVIKSMLQQKAKQGQPIPVVMVTGLTSDVECAMRILSATSRVEMKALGNCDLTEADLKKLEAGMQKLNDLPLYINSGNISLCGIESTLKWFKENQNTVPIIAIDNIESVIDSHTYGYFFTIESLRRLADEYQTPIFFTANIKEKKLVYDEYQSNYCPKWYEIEQTFACEDMIDKILIVNREELYNLNCERCGVADVIIAKNKGGMTETISLAYTERYACFDNLASEFYE